MRSEKLFSILVIAGGALAANLAAACNGSTPDPGKDGGGTTTDSGSKPDTGVAQDSGSKPDTGTGDGAAFW